MIDAAHLREIRDGAEKLGGITIVSTHGPDFHLDERLGYEKEVLRRYVSASPMDGWEHEIRAESYATLDQILEASWSELPDGTAVTVAGIFLDLWRRVGKARPWAEGEFQDLERVIQVKFYGTAYGDNRKLLRINTPLVLDATVKRSDDRPIVLMGSRVRHLDKHVDCDCVEEQEEEIPDIEPVNDIEVTEANLAKLKELAQLQQEGVL